MNIGERIKQRRKELKISADVVGEKIGVSRSTVFRYESGDIEKLPIEILIPLSEVLKTTPAELMGWEVNDINDIYNQLEPLRQQKVYNFAEHQLKQQNGEADDTILFAAHSKDDLTDEEKQQINDFIDKVRKEKGK